MNTSIYRVDIARRAGIAAVMLVLALLGACTQGPEQRMAQARAAYERGDHAQARDILARLVKTNHRAALAFLGAMYSTGDGVERNLARGFDLQMRAAELGHVQAQYNVAVMLSRGLGVKQNLKAAFEWFNRAARGGLAEAKLHLGLMYEKGWGVSACPYGATRWYYRAGIAFLDQGDVKRARFALQSMHRLLPDFYLVKELSERISLYVR